VQILYYEAPAGCLLSPGILAANCDPGLVGAFSDVQQEFQIIRDAIAGQLTGSDFSKTMASV
jgi:hypothetical protein